MRISLLRTIRLIKDHPSQRGIMLLAVAILVVFVLFGYFVYIPNREQMMVVKKDLIQARMRLRELQSLVGQGRSIREGIQLVNEEFSRLDRKMPVSCDEGLKGIPALAAQNNVDIVSLKRKEAGTAIDERGGPILFRNKEVKSISVALDARGYYKDIIGFIENMEEFLPGFLYVDTMRIKSDAGRESKLSFVIDMTLFSCERP
jgi:hypothetical protein